MKDFKVDFLNLIRYRKARSFPNPTGEFSGSVLKKRSFDTALS